MVRVIEPIEALIKGRISEVEYKSSTKHAKMYRLVEKGERVTVKGDMDSMVFKGHKGTVLKTVLGAQDGYMDNIAIEFDERIGGHDCSGLGRSGHCYYVKPSYITSLEE